MRAHLSADTGRMKEHYVEILKLTLPFDNEDIENIAKENLSKIGERYNDNRT